MRYGLACLPFEGLVSDAVPAPIDEPRRPFTIRLPLPLIQSLDLKARAKKLSRNELIVRALTEAGQENT